MVDWTIGIPNGYLDSMLISSEIVKDCFNSNRLGDQVPFEITVLLG